MEIVPRMGYVHLGQPTDTGLAGLSGVQGFLSQPVAADSVILVAAHARRGR